MELRSMSSFRLPPQSKEESTAKRKNETEPTIIVTSSCSKFGKCKLYIYFLGGLLALFITAVLINAFFPYPIRASCIVKWKFGNPCVHVMQKFRCQILNWSSYVNCGPRGSRCFYTLKEPVLIENDVIRASHVVLPNLQFGETIKITFKKENQTCVATGESTSDEWFRIFDYGANYCNLHNLVVGAGFDVNPKFLELTTNAICTQYGMAICD